MYNLLDRKGIFQKNIVRNFSKTSTAGITEIFPSVSIPTKEIVECASVSTSNLTLSGSQSVNGVTTGDGDVILVNAQTDAKDNGIYIADTNAWERIENNLNEISLVLIIDGDLKGSIYYLDNKPVILKTDNINYLPLRESNQANILTTTYDFDESDIIASVSTLQVIIPAISGFDIQVIDVNISFTSSSLTLSNPAYLTYTNGTNYTYTIADTFWTGTGTVRAELKKYSGASTNAYSSGDDWGLYSPSLIYTSGTITGKFYVTYRYVAS